jgi:hypothetical protein
MTAIDIKENADDATNGAIRESTTNRLTGTETFPKIRENECCEEGKRCNTSNEGNRSPVTGAEITGPRGKNPMNAAASQKMLPAP